MAQHMLGRRLARRLTWLDRWEDKVQPFVRDSLRKAMPLRDALDGTWLGVPLHPALTDVPLGATNAALMLDISELVTGSPRAGIAADRALAVGVIATLPAAMTGASDWRDLRGETRRVASAHALFNVAGLVLNAYSVLARAQGHRRCGQAASAAGVLTTAVAAHIGGELSFGFGLRMNHNADHAGPVEFTDVLDDADLSAEKMHRVDVAGTPVLVARSRSGEPCAIAAVCSHAGGQLDEGQRTGDTVTCPLHGSTFDLRTGDVLHGPAVLAEPHYETRTVKGRVAIRLSNT